jgi:hypothetical protein
MNKRVSFALLLIAALQSSAQGATGNLTVYADADAIGFDHNSAGCGSSSFASWAETTVVHSGSAAVAVSKLDNNGVGWQSLATYSASSDYDGISFWINAGDIQTELTSLAIFDGSFTPHFLHLEDVYGASLPVNTWISFHIPFSSPFFVTALSTPPERSGSSVSSTTAATVRQSSSTSTTSC